LSLSPPHAIIGVDQKEPAMEEQPENSPQTDQGKAAPETGASEWLPPRMSYFKAGSASFSTNTAPDGEGTS
jgi:hypothetical protein